MSEFKELIKSFPKTREYVRDFFVYGFKTREEFKEKSARTYDNERRRIESWLSGYVQQDYTEKGKNISLAIDSNLLDTNPLYRVWKTKSFTDNDILLHFFLLDCLTETTGMTVEEITDTILNEYEMCFDTQLVRRKCNAYVKDGLLQKKKTGKELLYYKSPAFDEVLCKHPMLDPALQFYQFSAPTGIIGDTILDTLNLQNETFRVKHSFFVHTLEDAVLLEILKGIQEQRQLTLDIKGTKRNNEIKIRGVPLQIFTSTRTGRRFLLLYNNRLKRFGCQRMDSIKNVTLSDTIDTYSQLRQQLDNCRSKLWGVSFDGRENARTETLRLTLRIIEGKEDYILERLQREGKDGIITRVQPNLYTYEKEVYDCNEMHPWIRTFIGRIENIECSSSFTEKTMRSDLEKMYELYDI